MESAKDAIDFLWAGKWEFVHTWWFILLVLNALAGITLLERAWIDVSRFRNPNMELEELMPAVRRTDALYWRKWMLYPGAMTLLIPRVLFTVVLMCANAAGVRILLIGADVEKPLIGPRKFLINCLFYICWRLISVFGLFTWHTY